MAAPFPPADLEQRFRALVVDRVLGLGLLGLGCWPAARAWQAGRPATAFLLVAVVALVVWLMAALLEAATGATPGKALVRVRTLQPDSRRPGGLGRGLARAAVLGAAGWPTAGIGLALLGWSAATDPSGRRRGWHDLVGGVVVVDVRPRPPEEGPAAEPLVNLSALGLAAPGTADTVVRARPSGPRRDWSWTLEANGRTHEVGAAVLVGRDPRPRPGEPVVEVLVLADASVSRTHARVQVARDGALVVVDRGSTNGSALVRGHAVRRLAPGRATTLVDGDRLRLGDTELTVRRRAAQAVISPCATSYTSGVAAASRAPSRSSRGE